MRELWGHKPYRLIFLAGFLSELGTYVSEVAILLRIFELVGHQKQYLGITQGLFLVLMILGTLLGGVLGERPHKTQLLIGFEVARIPILLGMLWAADSPWTLILCNGSVAFFSGAFNPTRQALMNDILPSSLLPKANSLFSVSFAFLHAIGPVLGAMAYEALGSLTPVLIFDLATYILGIGILFRLLRLPSGRAPAEAHASPGFFEDLRAGFTLVSQRKDFLWVLIRCAVASGALGILIPMLLPMTTEVLKLPESAYGLLLGALGLGGALGSLFMPWAAARFKVLPLLRLLTMTEALSLLAWFTFSHPYGAFLLAFLYGALLFGRLSAQLNFVSLALPPEYNARANAFLDLAMVVPNVLGAGVVALAGASTDTAQILKLTGCLFVAGIGCLLLLELCTGPRCTSSSPTDPDTRPPA